VIGLALLALALLLPVGQSGRLRPVPVLVCAVVVTAVGLVIYGPSLSAIASTGFAG